jgi:hypothetical protein
MLGGLTASNEIEALAKLLAPVDEVRSICIMRE